jgi:hypothetical protein
MICIAINSEINYKVLLCLFLRVQLFSDDISVFSPSRLFSSWSRDARRLFAVAFSSFTLSLSLTLSSLWVEGSACLSQLTRDGERVLHEDDRKKTIGHIPQSTYIYRVPQGMFPRRNWDSPNSSPPLRACGWGGWGSPNADDFEKKHSALPTLWHIQLQLLQGSN